jgi:ankyrin repeat protein
MARVNELFEAVQRGNIELVRTILHDTSEARIGVDAHFLDFRLSRFIPETTALMIAAQYGQEKVLNLLLNQGANAKLKNSFGHNALYIALTSSDNLLTDVRLDAFANEIAKRISYAGDDYVCLAIAAKKGLVATVKTLLDNNVHLLEPEELSATNEYSINGLAIAGQNKVVIQTLLNAQAKFTEKHLLYAASISSPEVLQILLDEYNLLNFDNLKTKHAAFKAVLRRKDFSTIFNDSDILALLETIAAPTIVQTDEHGLPLLFAAIRSGSLSTVRLMEQTGYNPKISDEYGNNAISYALTIENEDAILAMLRLLIEDYAVPVDTDPTLQQPLVVAAATLSPAILELLASHTYNINAISRLNGQPTTPLIETFKESDRFRSESKIAILLKFNADIAQQVMIEHNSIDSSGEQISFKMSAIRAYALMQRWTALQLILEYAVQNTALHYAVKIHLDETFPFEDSETSILRLILEDNNIDIGIAAHLTRLLFEYNCNHNSLVAGVPLIVYAIAAGNLDVLATFLQKTDIDLSPTFRYKSDPLHFNIVAFAAVAVEEPKILEAILKFNGLSDDAKTELVNHSLDNNRTSIIMHLIKNNLQRNNVDNCIAKITALIRAGARIDAIDSVSRTAADYFRRSDVKKLLSNNHRNRISTLLQPEPTRSLFFSCFSDQSKMPEVPIRTLRQTIRRKSYLS